MQLEQYEIKIQHFEDLYEQELVTFQSEILKTQNSYQISRLNELMYFIKIYVYHHTKLLLGQIRYKGACFHAKLLRHHRRYTSLSTRNMVDVPKLKLNQNQLDYLSRTGQLYSL